MALGDVITLPLPLDAVGPAQNPMHNMSLGETGSAQDPLSNTSLGERGDVGQCPMNNIPPDAMNPLYTLVATTSQRKEDARLGTRQTICLREKRRERREKSSSLSSMNNTPLRENGGSRQNLAVRYYISVALLRE